MTKIIKVIGKTQRKINPEVVAKALGAEKVEEGISQTHPKKIPYYLKKKNEEKLANYCRDLISRDYYKQAFDIFNGKPEMINYFTAGELSRYLAVAPNKNVTLTNIRKVKTNIEKTIFGRHNKK